MSAAASDPLVIAIDSSTTSTKAIIVDAEGRVLALGKREIPLHTPAPAFYEHDPLQWWTTTNDAIAEAVGALKDADRERIVALGMTHQRETFAPFDADGQPLRNGILWLDGRAPEQIKKYGSDEIHALSGKPADITPAIYKMAWVKENQPGLLAKAHKVVSVHGYLVFRLTGRWVDSVACADSLGLFDIAAQQFDDRLLTIAGVTREQMPDLVKPGEVIADVDPAIAKAWGLTQPLPLVAGMGDGQAAGVGAAATEPHVMYLNLGTAVVAGVHGPDYKFAKAFRTLAAGVPDWYDFELLQSSGAYLSTWFRQTFGKKRLKGRPDPKLEKRAAELPIGCGGLLTMPYWNAVQSPYWDPIARGAMAGWQGAHTPAAFYRSILEAIGLEMRRSLEGLESTLDTKVTEIRAMGGGVRSPLWRQIMTDALGVPITACTEDEISALGAAVAAMSITGVHGEPDIATYAQKMAKFGDVTEPDADRHRIYGELSAIQGKMYPALKEINDEIHAFAVKYGELTEHEAADDEVADL